MTALDNIKNQLIDKILVTNNEDLLMAIDSILKSTQSDPILKLNSHQIELLKMSEQDVKYGNIISETDLEREDAEWMDK